MSRVPVPVTDQASPGARRSLGVGRVLIIVYAILAIGATSRAVYQLVTIYSSARVPITLSAVSGVVYIVATLALLLRGPAWYRVAWITISFELLGVLVVGTLSLLDPTLFAGSAKVSFGTVWSYYGIGYLFIPLVLPVLGMLWLRSRRDRAVDESAEA
jgi:magnesium-transporting ATPase (P-type)